ncbi:MAG: hypothetical protein ABIN67_08550 [Ferruginibacter sp.]
MAKLNRSYILIILSLLFCACEKELSLEGTLGGTAVFTFISSPGACINPGINGTYQAGSALDATNTVTIAVDVATAGTYTVSTATLNGISFVGTGTFTTTGPQTISLTGAGTPAAGGTFSFTPGTTGCSFIINVSGGGGSSGGTAVYTFDGSPTTCVNFNAAGNYAAGIPLTASNFVTVNVNVTTVGTYTISTQNLNGISFSGSGTFAAAGPQAIQLAGTGTPLSGSVFNYVAGTNGCTFPITFAGLPGAAVFTYSGAPGACTTATPAGTFAIGTPLSAANTVIVDVDVSTIGTYSITTPAVNGISFAATGSFATTGPQQVTLVGSGTPVTDGIFNYIPTNGCSFPIIVTAAADFIKCTIAGVARTFNVGASGAMLDPKTLVLAGNENSSLGSPTFEIDITSSNNITTATYNRPSVTNLTTFCIAWFSDGANPTPWGVGIGTQTGGFSVTITSLTPTTVKGTFSGTLYDNQGLGNSGKAITAGSFSITL